MKCPECNGFMDLHNSKHGWFYKCTNYANCDMTHGAHQDSLKPLGRPADKETRVARQVAHIMMSGYMENIGCKKSTIYKRLAKVMGMSKRRAHIANFNIKQCEELYEYITQGRL